MESQRNDIATSVGLLVLRLGMGAYMMTHGWGKLQMVISGKFDEFGDPIGLGSALSLILASGAEFFCALLVVIGLATRLAAVPVVFTMIIAAFVVHGADPWTMGPGRSKEPALLYLIPFLAIVLTGPGPFSLDAVILPRLRRRSAARKLAK